MWKCPADEEHQTCYVYTGEKGLAGFFNKHIIYCYQCTIALAVDDDSGETNYDSFWGDGEYHKCIPQPAQPTINLLGPPPNPSRGSEVHKMKNPFRRKTKSKY